MKSNLFSLLSLAILLTLIASPLGSASASRSQMQANGITSFVNVNVIPMDTERVLENHTVIVEGDRITAMGPVDEVTVPDGAEVIEGNGAYLMPGLADMHTHLHYDSDPKHMILYLAHGVTTLRNLNGIPEHFEWREQIANGSLLGPTIFTSGNGIYGLPNFLRGSVLMFKGAVLLAPMLLGLLVWLIIWLLAKFTPVVPNFSSIRRFRLPSLVGLLIIGAGMVFFRVIPVTNFLHLSYSYVSAPETEAEARQIVQDQKAAGADFIKPHDWLSREHFFTVMDEAEKQNMYVAGHTTDSPYFVSLEEAFKAGQDEVVHADEFMSYLFVDFDPKTETWVEYEVDMTRIDGIVKLMAENEVALCPTLITNEAFLLSLEDISVLDRPEYRLVLPSEVAAWRDPSSRLLRWKGQEAYRRSAWRSAMLGLTKAAHDQGILITSGSDVSIEGIVPGYSLHLEFPLLVEAGLSNFEALAAGTRNAAQLAGRMGADSAWGTIAVGNRADLILLPNNPLEDVTHTQMRLGVMVQGQWFTQAELNSLMEEYIATYSKVTSESSLPSSQTVALVSSTELE